MGEPIEITDESFEREILNGELPAMVDFGAAWCPPCRAIEPIIKELVDDYDGKVKIAEVEVDSNREVAGKFGIMSVPTLIFFKGGREVDRLIGLRPKDVIKGRLDALL